MSPTPGLRVGWRWHAFFLLYLLWGWQASAWAQGGDASRACGPHILGIYAAQSLPTGASLDSTQHLNWTRISLPDEWGRRWPDYRGAVWYRIDWERSCPDQPVALAFNSLVMAGEVFVNRELLWQDRNLSEPLSRSWNMPRYWVLPHSALRSGVNQIWIRVHGRAADHAGLGTVKLGTPEVLKRDFSVAWWSQRTIIIINITASLVMTALFGFTWLQNRHYRVLGWYALNTLLIGLLLIMTQTTESWPFSSSLTIARVNIWIFIAFFHSFCIFVWSFGDLRLPRLERALWVCLAVASIMVVFLPERWLHLAHGVVWAYVALIVAICVWFPWRAWQTRRFAHVVFAVCLPLFLIVGLHDLLRLSGIWGPGVALMPYTVPISQLALGMMLGRQLTMNRRRIERFNAELTESVARACDELNISLEREHALALRHHLLQERMQISHDLHDSLGGSLMRSIALVEQSHRPLPNAQMLSMLKLMRDDLRQLIDHGASGTLSVPQTPAQWAAPLRHRFGMIFEELDLNAEWELPEKWLTMPSALQCLAMTRVLEEALTNVIKHSRARNVTVKLIVSQPHELVLQVTDDGIGFDVQAAQDQSLGIGMRSMLARMRNAQGNLNIQSAYGATCVQAYMRLNHSEA